MSLCVPEDHFSVCEVSSHEELTAPAQLERMVNNMDVQWAFRGPGNLGPDSWLLLQRHDGNGSESGGIVMLCIQSKKRRAEACMQSGKLGEEAGKILHIQGVDSLMALYPDTAADWDYSKNQGRPSDFTASSEYLAWWSSPQRGSWQQIVQSCTSGSVRRLPG
ncbi:hypothetical protein ABBQ32_012944 [Trebouxia sp. C0010 RCD-2024]